MGPSGESISRASRSFNPIETALRSRYMAKAVRTIQPMGQMTMVSAPNKRVQTANENKAKMPHTAKSTSNCQRRTIEGISAKRQEKKYAVPKGAAQMSNT